jgi:hypothetical protein
MFLSFNLKILKSRKSRFRNFVVGVDIFPSMYYIVKMRQEYDFSAAKLNPYVGRLRDNGEKNAKGGYFTEYAPKRSSPQEPALRVAEPAAAYGG